MPTYIALLRYTSEGIKGIKQRWAQGNPQEQARQQARTLGCELKSAYLTMGQYDGIAIVDASDDTTVAKLALATGMQGVSHPETLRAFHEAEVRDLVQSLP